MASIQTAVGLFHMTSTVMNPKLVLAAVPAKPRAKLSAMRRSCTWPSDRNTAQMIAKMATAAATAKEALSAQTGDRRGCSTLRLLLCATSASHAYEEWYGGSVARRP